jgi:thiamine-monophosphate kinase
MPGEFDFIHWIRSRQSVGGIVSLAAGDDLAIVDWPQNDLLLVGVDQVLDGVHFDSAKHSPELIGRKVMNRNLSDCAAMACLPAAALVSVALPQAMSLEYARQLYTGIQQAGETFGCPIIGGETGTWEGRLAVVVTILGRSAGIEPIRRAGARAGDGVYVTGPLGGSIHGRHMTFTPRVELARKLAQQAPPNRPTAMIDLSDGVSRDLAHICAESGVGAVIDADSVPVHPDAMQIAPQEPGSGLHHALHDGEDYELLFTCPGRPVEGTRIGTITAERGIFLQMGTMRVVLEPGGWEHRNFR